MQELSQGIRGVTEEKIVDVNRHLRETSKKWAAYVLEKNQDKALKLGLQISKAICDYLNETEHIY